MEQEKFRTILTNLRDGNSTVDDWNLLLTRTPNNIGNLQFFKKECVKLSYGNEKVAQDNYDSLKQLNNPIAEINGKHNNKTSAKLPADYMGSLHPKLLLSKKGKVMLTRNLWTSVDLCNGTFGEVVHIIYKENDHPPSLPIAVIVQVQVSHQIYLTVFSYHQFLQYLTHWDHPTKDNNYH